MVSRIGARVGLSADRLILGGDHLGPAPWSDMPAKDAMREASKMISAYVESGFTKIHLDTTMSCADDPTPLPETTIAQRAAALAKVAEGCAEKADRSGPYYVIGSEVPPPGGARDRIETLAVTAPGSAKRTVEFHRLAFEENGLSDAFSRVVAVVVQPGVEFSNVNVIGYEPNSARALSNIMSDLPGMVFEAHSTDYQSSANLHRLVVDGFSFLKVGP